jgi:hypothetical protein
MKLQRLTMIKAMYINKRWAILLLALPIAVHIVPYHCSAIRGPVLE